MPNRDYIAAEFQRTLDTIHLLTVRLRPSMSSEDSQKAIVPDTPCIRAARAIIERALPFLHYPEMRAAIVELLSRVDQYEDTLKTGASASIHVSPHAKRARS